MTNNVAHGWVEQVAGVGDRLPVLDGRLAPYIHLDNAASTPPLREVLATLDRFMPLYSSVHRGAGFKSRVSTAAYEQARETIGEFVGAERDRTTVIFGKNTTEAINKLALRYPLPPRSIVISTAMEHHSNDLPWRHRAQVVRANVTREGRLDEDHVGELLRTYHGRVALLTVSGASNVTGFVQPIHRLARMAHRAGARIFVDAAQLAPHRRIDMRPLHDPEHLDFVALSAHKMYAPFGTGALIGHRDVFLQGAPDYQGGGTVDTVTPTDVRWAGLPDREEAGTPNVAGAIAMAAAARVLLRSDREELEQHEAALTGYALDRLRSVPGLTLYGESHLRPDRVGVIAFNLDGFHHALVAAIVGYEGGIGVRNGCFCAQSYVAHLLRGAAKNWDEEALHGERAHRPGMVRISFGAYNTFDDIDAIVDVLFRIVRRGYCGQYYQDLQTGDFRPAGYVDAIQKYFSIGSQAERGAILTTLP